MNLENSFYLKSEEIHCGKNLSMAIFVGIIWCRRRKKIYPMRF
jgi:hypothetical protein